jgi:hypothetical protein
MISGLLKLENSPFSLVEPLISYSPVNFGGEFYTLYGVISNKKGYLSFLLE